MKLAISNISWELSSFPVILDFVKELGCEGIEVAPGLVWEEPINSTYLQRRQFQKEVNNRGLRIIGFHALLYNKKNMNILGSELEKDNAVLYLKRLAKVCSDVGGRTMIFGSPANRRKGKMDYKQALGLAAKVFLEVAEYSYNYGVIICIEPLGPSEADFILNCKEAIELVDLVAHPGFGLHLDVKAMRDAGEDFAEILNLYGTRAKHFHINEPGLRPLGSTGFDHSVLGKIVNHSQYNGYLSIEMRRGFGEERKVIQESIEYAKRCYGLGQ